MLIFISFVMICAASVQAQDGEITVPDNKTECINQLMEWCDNMQYPQQGVGLAVVSITYEDPKGYYRVLCSSDSDGTNCTRNRTPWFACSPNHELSYKGQVITNTSKNVDDEICTTADKAFNEILVQNLSYDNTTLKTEVEKGMEAFFEQMAAMEEQIELIQRILKKLPALGDFWGEFNDSFLFLEGNSESTTTTPGDQQNSTEPMNQI